ncbi:MAG: S8 family serine peptidase, partial [Acidobacteria bacterium]|nr:S8 family serine peptidase [Acidobacteriota bacterium]
MSRFPRPRLAAALAGLSLVLVTMLLVGFATSLAGRDNAAGDPEGFAGGRRLRTAFDPFDPGSSYFYFQRNRRPSGHARIDGLSPFGAQFKSVDLPSHRQGLLLTSLGVYDPRDPKGLEKLPASLRRPTMVTRPGRGGLAPGVNIVQIEASALRRRGPAGIERELSAFGRVVGTMEDRGFILRGVERKQLDALADLPYVEAMMPYHDGFKIDRGLGRVPFIQEKRARERKLEIMIASWPGARSEEILRFRAEVESVVGRDAVGDFASDGTILQATVLTGRIPAIARLVTVRAIQEVPEMLLSNAEGTSLVMVGSVEDTLGARPYHDIGIDGGGIDTNGDGRRVNDGSDTVPPQIVAVLDNGLSVDSAQFSETATQPEIPFIRPIGPAHRKVHGIQFVADSGQTCDAILSGSGTHGNVVAGAIAGSPTEIGVFATKTLPVGIPMIVGINMDGVARGARILMQDAAAPSRCTFDELIERGGNITPGNLAARMAAARDAGDNVHLHVMPFGVPNFDNLLTNSQNGNYSIEASQIDTFLVNNRDYMVFVPVGSQGASPSNRAERLYPDLFNGSSLDNDPNIPSGLQIPPPATAKNIVSVGSHRMDMQTFAGDFNEEEVGSAWSSRGPATAASLRTAPIVMAPGEDFNGIFAVPLTGGVAVFRSSDNDNAGPVEHELDELNFGTSFSSAYAAGAGALVRDYFAQGFYPTAGRNAADRMPELSGALVKAALVASANFLEQSSQTDFPTSSDRNLGQARALNLGVIQSDAVGIIGNNEQGYGRVVVTQVLPLSNWPDSFILNPNSVRENPAQGLLVWDDIATGEPLIDNTTRTSATHTFRLTGPNLITAVDGGV